MKTTDGPIILEFIYASSRPKLWQALTQLDHMLEWYFPNIDKFSPEEGSQSKFVVKTDDGRTFTHLWKVTNVNPLSSITYSWKYAEYKGLSTTQFDIMPNSENTVKLVLTLEILEDFPQDIPEFKVESCRAGWSYFLNQRLHTFLEEK